jgi:hypothetical protein
MNGATPIILQPTEARRESRILQLYPQVELFSEGEPRRNSLFIFGQAPGPLLAGSTAAGDQLLVIDPPPDLASRFRLQNQTAVLFTGEPMPAGAPLLQTVAGGTAHIRLGEHYLDIHAHRTGALIHLPALGLLCSGQFGSDITLPMFAADSTGDDELQTLLLLARLLKQHRFQLLIPHTGTPVTEKSAALARLASDVAYLNGLRRLVPPPVRRGEGLEKVMEFAAPLVPTERSNATAHAVHRANVAQLHRLHQPSDG